MPELDHRSAARVKAAPRPLMTVTVFETPEGGLSISAQRHALRILDLYAAAGALQAHAWQLAKSLEQGGLAPPAPPVQS